MTEHAYSVATITNVITSMEHELETTHLDINIKFLMVQWLECLRVALAEMAKKSA